MDINLNVNSQNLSVGDTDANGKVSEEELLTTITAWNTDEANAGNQISGDLAMTYGGAADTVLDSDLTDNTFTYEDAEEVAVAFTDTTAATGNYDAEDPATWGDVKDWTSDDFIDLKNDDIDITPALQAEIISGLASGAISDHDTIDAIGSYFNHMEYTISEESMPGLIGALCPLGDHHTVDNSDALMTLLEPTVLKDPEMIQSFLDAYFDVKGVDSNPDDVTLLLTEMRQTFGTEADALVENYFATYVEDNWGDVTTWDAQAFNDLKNNNVEITPEMQAEIIAGLTSGSITDKDTIDAIGSYFNEREYTISEDSMQGLIVALDETNKDALLQLVEPTVLNDPNMIQSFLAAYSEVKGSELTSYDVTSMLTEMRETFGAEADAVVENYFASYVENNWGDVTTWTANDFKVLENNNVEISQEQQDAIIAGLISGTMHSDSNYSHYDLEDAVGSYFNASGYTISEESMPGLIGTLYETNKDALLQLVEPTVLNDPNMIQSFLDSYFLEKGVASNPDDVSSILIEMRETFGAEADALVENYFSAYVQENWGDVTTWDTNDFKVLANNNVEISQEQQDAIIAGLISGTMFDHYALEDTIGSYFNASGYTISVDNLPGLIGALYETNNDVLMNLLEPIVLNDPTMIQTFLAAYSDVNDITLNPDELFENELLSILTKMKDNFGAEAGNSVDDYFASCLDPYLAEKGVDSNPNAISSAFAEIVDTYGTGLPLNKNPLLISYLADSLAENMTHIFPNTEQMEIVAKAMLWNEKYFGDIEDPTTWTDQAFITIYNNHDCVELSQETQDDIVAGIADGTINDNNSLVHIGRYFQDMEYLISEDNLLGLITEMYPLSENTRIDQSMALIDMLEPSVLNDPTMIQSFLDKYFEAKGVESNPHDVKDVLMKMQEHFGDEADDVVQDYLADYLEDNMSHIFTNPEQSDYIASLMLRSYSAEIDDPTTWSSSDLYSLRTNDIELSQETQDDIIAAIENGVITDYHILERFESYFNDMGYAAIDAAEYQTEYSVIDDINSETATTEDIQGLLASVISRDILNSESISKIAECMNDLNYTVTDEELAGLIKVLYPGHSDEFMELIENRVLAEGPDFVGQVISSYGTDLSVDEQVDVLKDMVSSFGESADNVVAEYFAGYIADELSGEGQIFAEGNNETDLIGFANEYLQRITEDYNWNSNEKLSDVTTWPPEMFTSSNSTENSRTDGLGNLGKYNIDISVETQNQLIDAISNQVTQGHLITAPIASYFNQMEYTISEESISGLVDAFYPGEEYSSPSSLEQLKLMLEPTILNNPDMLQPFLDAYLAETGATSNLNNVFQALTEISNSSYFGDEANTIVAEYFYNYLENNMDYSILEPVIEPGFIASKAALVELLFENFDNIGDLQDPATWGKEVFNALHDHNLDISSHLQSKILSNFDEFDDDTQFSIMSYWQEMNYNPWGHFDDGYLSNY